MCNMSTILKRFESLERSLWWDIDTTIVDDTGCLLPCSYDHYEIETKEDMQHPISRNFVYPNETRYVLQVSDRLPALILRQCI